MIYGGDLMNKGVRENLRTAVAKNKRVSLILLNGGSLKGRAEAITYRMIKIQTDEEALWVPITEIKSVSNSSKQRSSDTQTEPDERADEARQITIRHIKEAIAEEEHPRQLRALAELLITYLDKLDPPD
jgi:hypothetical protein